MIDKDIYIDLVSNASMDLYPLNKLSSFTNKLAHPIELEGAWEIGLIELFHSNKIHHSKKNTSYLLYQHGFPVNKHTKTILEYRVGMQLEKLLNNINLVFDDIKIDDVGYLEGKTYSFTPPNFTLVEGKVALNVGKIWYDGKKDIDYSYFAPLFDDPNLLTMLGFDYREYTESVLKQKSFIITAKYKPDLNATSNLLFIYCDIIDEHNVGDTMANSLRTIPLNSGVDSTISSHLFPNTYYFKVKYNRIETISIILTDETGIPVIFKHGRTYLKLHLRRVRW